MLRSWKTRFWWKYSNKTWIGQDEISSCRDSLNYCHIEICKNDSNARVCGRWNCWCLIQHTLSLLVSNVLVSECAACGVCWWKCVNIYYPCAWRFGCGLDTVSGTSSTGGGFEISVGLENVLVFYSCHGWTNLGNDPKICQVTPLVSHSLPETVWRENCLLVGSRLYGRRCKECVSKRTRRVFLSFSPASF